GQQGNQAKGWLLRQNGQVRAIRVKGNLACSDGSVLHQWTLAGMGLAWRSLWEVQEDIANGKLITVLDEFAAPPNGIFALMPERKHLPQRLRLFLEMLKSHYSSPSYWTALARSVFNLNALFLHRRMDCGPAMNATITY